MIADLARERRRRIGGPVYRVGGPTRDHGWLLGSTRIDASPRWSHKGTIASWIDLEAAERAAAWSGGAVYLLTEAGDWQRMPTLPSGAH